MLEEFYRRPDVVDGIRASWIGELIEETVRWLHERGYSRSVIVEHVCILRRFGEFATERGASEWAQLGAHAKDFIDVYVQEKRRRRLSDQTLMSADSSSRIAIERMLQTVGPVALRYRKPPMEEPFSKSAPGFFAYLRDERGLRLESIKHYVRCLRKFESYLESIGLQSLADLSAQIVSSFITDGSRRLAKSDLRAFSGNLRVFLRYLRRERIIARDLSLSVEQPREYSHSNIPRSIDWIEVRRVLESIDRRSAVGRRDYAMLLLLVTYGLRAREVANLTLEDIDWRNERLRVSGRKAGHSAAFPLSTIVATGLLEYLQNGRPESSSRRLFLGSVAPYRPIEFYVISQRCSQRLRRAGIKVHRAGSHTFRHTCVQRLVDADFSLKQIGDYIGHRSPDSTKIYSKIAIGNLRQIAIGDGEDLL